MLGDIAVADDAGEANESIERAGTGEVDVPPVVCLSDELIDQAVQGKDSTINTTGGRRRRREERPALSDTD